MAMVSKNPRPRAKERACDKDIRKTLSYSAVFKYPMSKFQLYSFLITRNNYSVKFFERSLRRLVKKRHIKAKNGKYHLTNIRPISWGLRDRYTKDLFESAKIGFKALKAVPWIKMAAVTGSAASNNAQKDDDLDIFIITEKNRLWITRGFVTLILSVINKYARGGEGNGKFCCNLFVDESRSKWKKEARNLYVAREILSMHPFIDRDNMYFRFLKQNDWCFRYFRNQKISFPEKLNPTLKGKSLLVNLAENIARKTQLRFMRVRKTSEVTTKRVIHFNKHDHTKNILDQYKEFLKTELVS